MNIHQPDSGPLPSTSADTIRRLPLHLSVPLHLQTDTLHSDFSEPTSPHSSYPSSPSGESVSSLPSVSSSFLFSSGPGSPRHPGHHHDLEHEHDENGLIIPSLTLPSPLRRPTPYGQTLGEVRLIVLGRSGTNSADAVSVLVDEECEDVVEAGQWEPLDGEAGSQYRQKILRASTDWIEHRDAHGLDRHEPTRNVEIVHFPEYSLEDSPETLVQSVLDVIHSPFRSLFSVINPEQPPNATLTALLSSPSSPLYSALVLLLSHPHSPLEQTLISELSAHIPIIILPPLPTYHADQSPYPQYSRLQSRRPSLQPQETYRNSSSLSPYTRLSAVRPHSMHALRTSLFRVPETLATLRLEAAERFLRWREVEQAVARVLRATRPKKSPQSSLDSSVIGSDESSRTGGKAAGSPELEKTITQRRRKLRWDKAKWEAEWEGVLSTEVAKALKTRRVRDRRKTVTLAHMRKDILSPTHSHLRSRDHIQKRSIGVGAGPRSTLGPKAPSFDPLHLPSILVFSFSLLAPLKERIASVFRLGRRDSAAFVERHAAPETGSHSWAVFGAFCAGIGVGVLLSTRL